jgi:hypothetical protein
MLPFSTKMAAAFAAALLTTALALSQTTAPASTPRNTLADYEPGSSKRSTPSARYSPTPSHAPTPKPPRPTTLSKTSRSPTEPTFVYLSKPPLRRTRPKF